MHACSYSSRRVLAVQSDLRALCTEALLCAAWRTFPSIFDETQVTRADYSSFMRARNSSKQTSYLDLSDDELWSPDRIDGRSAPSQDPQGEPVEPYQPAKRMRCQRLLLVDEPSADTTRNGETVAMDHQESVPDVAVNAVPAPVVVAGVSAAAPESSSRKRAEHIAVTRRREAIAFDIKHRLTVQHSDFERALTKITASSQRASAVAVMPRALSVVQAPLLKSYLHAALQTLCTTSWAWLQRPSFTHTVPDSASSTARSGHHVDPSSAVDSTGAASGTDMMSHRAVQRVPSHSGAAAPTASPTSAPIGPAEPASSQASLKASSRSGRRRNELGSLLEDFDTYLQRQLVQDTAKVRVAVYGGISSMQYVVMLCCCAVLG